MGMHHSKDKILYGALSMELGQRQHLTRLYTAWQFNSHPQTLRSPSKPGRAQYCTTSDVFRGNATISLVKTKSIAVKLLNLPFQHDKRKRRHTTTEILDTNPFTRSKCG
nr:hypothetical protein [Tanacetum cinerariifolium]